MMRSYLLQIATRASGIPETAPIKPVTQIWPAINLENNSNPFEEVIEPLSESSLGFDEQAARSVGLTDLLNNTVPSTVNLTPEDVILPNPPSYRGRQPANIPGRSNIPPRPSEDFSPSNPSDDTVFSLSPTEVENSSPSGNQAILPQTENKSSSGDPVIPSQTPNYPSGEVVVPMPSPQPENRFSNTDSAIVSEKPIAVDNFVSVEKATEVISDLERTLPIRPDSFERRATEYQGRSKSVAQHPSAHAQPSREPDTPGLNAVQQSKFEPTAPKLSMSPSRNREDDMSVPTLRPMTSIQPGPLLTPRAERTEQRLVIGRLKVEVVAPPEMTAQQTNARPARRAVRQQPRHEENRYRSKLRFGLGQL